MRATRLAVLISAGLLMTGVATSATAVTQPPTAQPGSAHHANVRRAMTTANNAPRSNLHGLSTAAYMRHFVVRRGSRLKVDGRPFRFTGGNAEYLGLADYGPNPSSEVPADHERYPTHFEINDALTTLHQMGATVVRVQTLGDSIGCKRCLEPSLGHFNKTAFRHLDWLVWDARRHGIKLIGEFSGDANSSKPSGQVAAQWASTDFYCVWQHTADCNATFFTNHAVLRDYERQMKVVLDHVNPLTGLAFKNDPTIAGWVDGNNLNLLKAAPPPLVESWLRKVSARFQQIDHRQLFIDISLTGADEQPTSSILKIPGIDVYGQEYYPHWFPGVQGGNRVDGASPLLHEIARRVAAAGKVYATMEFGWDHTNFTSDRALQGFLVGLHNDPNVGGDMFWALVGHSRGHGWLPIPADAHCSPTCETGEDGDWWALYYTGRSTASNSASDMAARAQLIRTAAYGMDGFRRTPKPERVPAPIITAAGLGRVVYEGSAGAKSYVVQRRGRHHWRTLCRHCGSNQHGIWRGHRKNSSCYRVIGIGLDGRHGPPSRPAGHCERGT